MSDGLVSARAWYGGLLAGLLPILLLGFVYSALADRTVFVLWALVAGALWVVLLRQGLGRGLAGGAPRRLAPAAPRRGLRRVRGPGVRAP